MLILVYCFASYRMEAYLLLDINRYAKCSLTRFRFVISDIFVHYARYRSNVTAREMTCPLCTISVENEVRIVLSCPGLDDVRSRYIYPEYCNFSSDFRLASVDYRCLWVLFSETLNHPCGCLTCMDSSSWPPRREGLTLRLPTVKKIYVQLYRQRMKELFGI